MRHRHKTPQTFSLWMVDVLACSLGAVIFLWLFNDRLARTTGSERDQLTDRKTALEDMLAQQVAELDALHALLNELGKDKDNLQAESGGKQKRIDELLKQLAQLVENSGALQKKLDALAKLNDALKDDVKAQSTQGTMKQKRIDELLLQLNKLADSKENVEKLLARRLKEMEALETQLAALGKKNTSLEAEHKADASTKQRKIDDLTKAAADLAKKLASAEESVKTLERTAMLLPKLRDELKGSKEKLIDEEAKRKLLEGDLAKRLEQMAKASKDFETLLLAKQALEKKLGGLSKDLVAALAYKEKLDDVDKKSLAMKDLLGKKDEELQATIKLLARLQGDEKRLKELMERRFAGLTLTGKKVVFLVDMSGSMDLLDENTPAATKWESVRDTLAKIMTSMTNLEQFQLVTFSEDVSHPLGGEGRWIDFDPKKSVEQVKEAMAKIKPSGGTNLHKGFDAAFKMRKAGLDTIYIFSDGLPSDGEGLTPQQDRDTLRDLQLRSLLLSRHLRKKIKEELNKPTDGQATVRINSIGFFYESPDVGAFLWALSREHDGSFVGMSKP